MKYRLYLGIFIYIFSILACGLPGSVPATATRYPLPSTPNFQGFETSAPPSLLEPAIDLYITASSEISSDPAINAFDGNPETVWLSGKNPEGWIQIDLGGTRTISSIRLTVTQYPEGETTHQIWGGETESTMQLLYEFKGHTSEFQVLEFNPPAHIENIRLIRVVTTQSPSWVAWREIEIATP